MAGGNVLHCKKCDRNLPEDSFSRRSASKTGRQSWCKQCMLKYWRNWSGSKDWRDVLTSTPKMRRCHQAVHRAILSGRLIRPKNCSTPGCTGAPAAHHPDYDKPLEVEWLCQPCHTAWHQANGDGLNKE